MAAWAAEVIPVMEGAQVQAGAITDAYLAELEATQLTNSTTPLGVDVSVVSTEALRGVPATEVWHRPAVTVWSALKDGADLPTAAERGLNRARSIAETDLQLAHTHAAQNVLSRKKHVAGYRRVPAGGRSCALCLLAATQRYRGRQLLPIHPGCHCTVAPIYGEHDPGHIIAPDQLEAVHRALEDATGTRDLSGAGYRDYVVEHEHGEIGPVLAIRGQSFTGPGDL
jgi:hypothetical protein